MRFASPCFAAHASVASRMDALASAATVASSVLAYSPEISAMMAFVSAHVVLPPLSMVVVVRVAVLLCCGGRGWWRWRVRSGSRRARMAVVAHLFFCREKREICER